MPNIQKSCRNCEHRVTRKGCPNLMLVSPEISYHKTEKLIRVNDGTKHICNQDGVERELPDLDYGHRIDCKHWETDGGYQEIITNDA